MKQRLFVILLAAVLLFSQAAFAQETYNRVFDYAGLLSGAEAEELEAAIIDFQENSGYDFAILISDNDHGYDDYQQLCDDFYLEQALGLGMDKTALVCFLDLNGDGYYYVSAYGDLKYLMVYEDIEYLANGAMDYFYDGDFAGAFTWTLNILTEALGNIGTAQAMRVFDYAEVLTEAEAEALEEAIAAFREQTGHDFVYLSTYEEMEGNQEGDYMMEFYQTHGFGDGDLRSGVVVYLDLFIGNYYVQNFGDMDTFVSQEELTEIVGNANAPMAEGKIYFAVTQIMDAYTANFR